MYGDEDLLALSGLQHLAFCERQWGLIHLEQVWSDNVDTLRGQFLHERADTAGYSNEDGTHYERSMSLVSHTLGLYGIADIVEFSGIRQTEIHPVEYKAGKPKVEDWDRIQLTAQAICLEEMYTTTVSEGSLFYGLTRRRENVQITSALRRRTTELAFRAHELFNAGATPKPSKNAHCNRCSLREICLPEIADNNAAEYWASYGEVLGKY